MGLFDNPREQIRRLQALEEKRRAADRQVASMTPEQATQMAAFDKWFPWMPKGVMYSLARSGQAALGNPVIEQVALQALAAKERSAIGLGQVGDPVGPEEKPKKKGLFGRIAGYSGADLLSDIPGGKRVIRNTQNLVADNLVTNTIQEHLGGTNPAARGLRMFSQMAGAIGDAPRQGVQGAYRSVSANIEDEGFGGFASRFDPRHPSRALGTLADTALDVNEQTELGQLMLQSKNGRVDAGSGFFIGGRVKEAQHEAEQKFGTILYPDGSRHARSIGRDLAGLVSEPGSDAYTAISGGADFMVAMGADQAAFGGIAVERRATKQLKSVGPGPQAIKAAEAGRTMTPRENMIDAMGGIFVPGKRLTVSPEGVRNFLASDRGAWLVDKLAETTSIKTLDRLTGGKIDPASLLALADETDPDVIRATAERLFTTGRVKGTPVTKLGQLGFSFKEKAPEHVRALNARMPRTGSEARHLRNPRESMTQFQREMDYLDINQETQDKFLRKFADAPDIGIVDPELANVASATHRKAVFEEFEEHMKGELARSVGMDEKGVARTRKLLQRENDRWKGETNYLVLNGQPKSFFGLIARKTKRNIGRKADDPYLRDIDGDIVDAEIVEPLALTRGGPVTTLERTGLLPALDDTVDAELLDEWDNWEETTEFLQPNVPTPWDLNELQSNYMPSPDWRKVKHQMGVIGKMHANGIEVPLKAMRDVQTAWKGLVIARPALLLRVMGEIQFAMTLRGASTWINHPLDMIAYVMGDSNAPKMLAKMRKRGTSDIRGEVWGGHEDDAGEWVSAQMRWREMENTSTFYRKANDEVLGNEFIIANKHQNPEGYYAGMADELHTISKSTFMFQRASDMLQGKSVEESVSWAWNNMVDERKVLANAFDDGDKILNLKGLDEYMRGVDERIMQATGDGNPELLQSLVSRKLRGETFDIKGVRNDKLNDVLRQFADNLPDDMRAPKTSNRGAATQMRDALKGAHGVALDVMFSNRERTLNRSPEFRQFYYRKAIENGRIVDPAEADAYVANLAKAGMKKNDLRTAKFHAEKAVDTPMTLREVDDLSFAQAQDEMQFFLEDLVDKKRWVEALSIVSPFAHVISESMTRWAKILSNPNAVAKVQRPFKSARDPELGDILGLNADFGPTGSEDIAQSNEDDEVLQGPDGQWMLEAKREGKRYFYDRNPEEVQAERRGLMYKDAQGNERVAFPITPMLTGIMGDPIPLHGRTQGLNMIGDFSPGVGPFASLPLTALSEKLDNPRYDKIREWIFPHGTPTGGIIVRNAMQFLPTWARKAVTEETPQQVIDAMYYKANQGDYNVQGEGATIEEINRLVNDSKQLAFMTKISNAAATFFAPTAPTPEWFIEDEGGQRIPMLAVVKDLQALRDADPRNATLNMLEKYGDNVFLMLVGKSVAVSPGVLPSTIEAEKWIRSDGKGLRGKYKNAYGFFAPQEGDFSFDAYRRLLDNGDRKLNDPDDVPYIANDMVAKARYYAYRAKIKNPSEARSAAALRDFREQLQKEYPGYDPDGPPGGTLNKVSNGELINELAAATTEKKLQDHAAMPALKAYLAYRTQIQGVAPKDRGSDWWISSNDGIDARAAAAQYGDQLAQESPAFAGMWEGALRREFENKLAEDDARNAEGRR